jgi:hypothetical protein
MREVIYWSKVFLKLNELFINTMTGNSLSLLITEPENPENIHIFVNYFPKLRFNIILLNPLLLNWD